MIPTGDAAPGVSAEGRRLMTPMEELRAFCRMRMLERSPTAKANPIALAELEAFRAAQRGRTAGGTDDER